MLQFASNALMSKFENFDRAVISPFQLQ